MYFYKKSAKKHKKNLIKCILYNIKKQPTRDHAPYISPYILLIRCNDCSNGVRMTDVPFYLAIANGELAERAGVGLRFVRELEQGKQTLRMDKVNDVLALFGECLGPVKNDNV